MPELFGDDILTVGELTRQVKSALREAFPKRIAVRGETSNVTLHRSGNVYFNLKDDSASLSAVMWKGAAAKLPFRPTDGMEVVATGEIDVYAGFGRYQLKALSLEPVGVGALDAAFRQLREKLAAEGLFEPAQKQSVPNYPRVVVIVTSPQAAGFQDVLKVFDRHPHIRKLVYPVAVQGNGAAVQIAEALEALSGVAHYVDAVLLGRGGGSLEDLWAFNEEPVAQAVAACRVPIVTGIGHETDTTLADLAADHHAHTPTAAAEYLTRHWAGIASAIDQQRTRLRVAVRRAVGDRRNALAPVARHRVVRRPAEIVEQRRQRADQLEAELIARLRERLRNVQRKVASLRERLANAHPRNRLARRREGLADHRERLREALRGRLRHDRDRLNALERRAAGHDPRSTVVLRRQHTARLTERLADAMALRSERLRGNLATLRARASAVDPEAVLARGFSITFDDAGRLVRRPGDADVGAVLTTRTAGGEIRSRVEPAPSAQSEQSRSKA
ncbi:MAG: exodeoxyribonuclease VII large subunit [Planctomycetota bacterium]